MATDIEYSLLFGADLNAVARLSLDSVPALCQRQNVDVLMSYRVDIGHYHYSLINTG